MNLNSRLVGGKRTSAPNMSHAFIFLVVLGQHGLTVLPVLPPILLASPSHRGVAAEAVAAADAVVGAEQDSVKTG